MQPLLVDNLEKIDQKSWDALLTPSPLNTIYQTYRWHAASWQTYQKDKELFLIAVKENETLLGVAPFFKLREGKIKVLKFLSALRGDYADFIYPKENAGIFLSIFQFLSQHKNLWDEIILENIPQSSTTHQLLQKAGEVFKIPVSLINKELSFSLAFTKDPALTQAILHKDKILKSQAHFKKLSGYEVLHLHRQEEILPYLDQFFAQHIERWGQTKSPSLFLESRHREFYQNLLKELDTTNFLTFSVVKSQGKSIAFHYGFSYDKTFLWYKPTFDIHLAKFSPGSVLLKEVMDYAFFKGFHEFDFTIGPDPYKERFTNEVRENFTYRLFKTPLAYRMHTLKKGDSHFFKQVKKWLSPFLPRRGILL